MALRLMQQALLAMSLVFKSLPAFGSGVKGGARDRALLRFGVGNHRILGGGIVGTHADDMIGEIALAIEMGADSVTWVVTDVSTAQK